MLLSERPVLTAPQLVPLEKRIVPPSPTAYTPTADDPAPRSVRVVPLPTAVQRSTPLSTGSFVSTKTSKAKLVTVFGTVNRHSLEVDVAPDASTPPYCQKGCTDPVNVPMPSAFATVTVPDPAVVVGPEETNTLMPPASAVVPSVVAMGWAVRSCTVTLVVNACVTASYAVPLDASWT